jgi:hypothetical protein
MPPTSKNYVQGISVNETHGLRVPEDFVDPRNQTDHYQLLSVFER